MKLTEWKVLKAMCSSGLVSDHSPILIFPNKRRKILYIGRTSGSKSADSVAPTSTVLPVGFYHFRFGLLTIVTKIILLFQRKLSFLVYTQRKINSLWQQKWNCTLSLNDICEIRLNIKCLLRNISKVFLNLSGISFIKVTRCPHLLRTILNFRKINRGPQLSSILRFFRITKFLQW